MKTIHQTISSLLRDVQRPIIFEVGAHKGEDTALLARAKNSVVHAFECDPRNQITRVPANVIVNYKAVSSHTGHHNFWLSEKYGSQWHCSSSLLSPKKHLQDHPDIKFQTCVQVPCVTLDHYCKDKGIMHIDFLWMDVQGAEHYVFEGAKRILEHTRFIYTEYANDEQYEGQKTLDDLLLILGQGWQIVQKWDYDVLLVNTRL